MKLKGINDFLNESYSVDYLAVIINKMKAEGKSLQVIYSYLDLLNIPKERIMTALAACGMVGESVNEEEDTSLEDLIDDVDAEEEDEKEKSSDDEEAEETEDESEEDEKEESDSDEKESALKDAIDDIEKMDKIKKIVKDEDSDEE